MQIDNGTDRIFAKRPLPFRRTNILFVLFAGNKESEFLATYARSLEGRGDIDEARSTGGRSSPKTFILPDKRERGRQQSDL